MRATPTPTTPSMRATPTPTTPSMSFRNLPSLSLSLRRHQVASLSPSNEQELHLLSLLHSHLSLSLLPDPPSSPTLSFPFLLKLLDTLLSSQSHFSSLLLFSLSRNPSLLSLPPLPRSLPLFLHRALQSLDILNSLSLSLHSLRLRNRYADIASSALNRPQISRARRALSKLLSHPCTSTPICSAKKSLQGFFRPGEPGGGSVLAVAVYTMTTLLQFCMWVMVSSFGCGGGEGLAPAPIQAGSREMGWAVALARLQERIGEYMRRERGLLVGGLVMLEESLVLERRGREVLEIMNGGGGMEGLGEAAAEFGFANRKLEEGLVLFEGKVREVFHRLVRCREEVIRCLGNGGGLSAASSLGSVDSV